MFEWDDHLAIEVEKTVGWFMEYVYPAATIAIDVILAAVVYWVWRIHKSISHVKEDIKNIVIRNTKVREELRSFTKGKDFK